PAAACGQLVSGSIFADCWEPVQPGVSTTAYAEIGGTNCTGPSTGNLSTVGMTTLNLGNSNLQCIGLVHHSGSSSVIKNFLNAPLQNGKSYLLSLWAANLPTTQSIINAGNTPVVLTIASYTHASFTAVPGYPAGLDV